MQEIGRFARTAPAGAKRGAQILLDCPLGCGAWPPSDRIPGARCRGSPRPELRRRRQGADRLRHDRRRLRRGDPGRRQDRRGRSTAGRRDFALVRYNPDGSLDTSFDGDGKVLTDFGAERPAHGRRDPGRRQDRGGGHQQRRRQPATSRWRATTPTAASTPLRQRRQGDDRLRRVRAIDAARGVAIQADGKIVAAGETGAGISTPTSPSPATTPTAASTRASAATAR